MYAMAARPGEPQRLVLAPDERRFVHDALERLDPEETSTEVEMLRVQLEIVGG